ncbi:hypothetical protein ACS0TY_034047 [Phlomoides rotata]
MAASRLFTLLRPSILRNSCQNPPPKFNTICLPPSLRFKRYVSSSLAIDAEAAPTPATDEPRPAVSSHPWPEWVSFVDRLKARGYFTLNGSGAGDEGILVYTDMKFLKDPSLSFARDRFDIFRSLSPQDIQTIVEKGCPSLLRKAVNSAKRLRAHLELDEGEVCSSCNLRESCDRAYIMLGQSEDGARTVDVVRLLLLCALDPLVISGESKPPGRELVESSARKLLLELVEFGERPPDPDLPKPASITAQRKKQSLDLSDNKSSKNVDMKPGDWVCTKCNFMNFARNVKCLKCEAERPRSASTGGIEMKKGDWNCAKCSGLNFARNRQCFRCQAPRPRRDLRPGDWECPGCNFLNFSRNSVCKKCNHDRPQESGAQDYQETWKKPY